MNQGKSNDFPTEKRPFAGKMLLSPFILLFVLLLVTGCAGGKSSDSATANGNKAVNAAADVATNSKAAGSGQASSEQLAFTADSNESKLGSEANSNGIGAGETALPENRKLIYHANATMEVADYAEASAKIRDLIALSGGYILQFTESQSLYERGGTFVIKVPSQGFFSFIEKLRQISPKTFQPAVEGQDVTEEYVDLESRLKAKQVVEARLLSFMEKATNSDSLLKFSNELASVQEEIEQIKGRMRYLDRNVAYSTIELRVREQLQKQKAAAEKMKGPVWERAGKALNGSLRGIASFFTELFIFLAGALPIILLLAAVAAPFVVWWRKRARYRKNPPSSRNNPASNDNDNADSSANM
ncbi:MAG TPA: DUF4349 domain-containing protein [Bacilli bacterium]